MTTTNSEDHDLLISELFAEAHGLRMKYEEFSQYTEAKIDDFVHAKQALENLLAQRTSLESLLAQRTQELAISNEQRLQDLAITSAQRAQIQAELVSLTARVDKLISQRNKARHRVKFLESSRGYRYEQRLRRLVARLLLRK